MAAVRNTSLNIAAAHRDFSYRPTDVLDALAAA